MKREEEPQLPRSPLSRLNVSLCGYLLVTFPVSWAQSSQPPETPILFKLTVWIPKVLSSVYSRVQKAERRQAIHERRSTSKAKASALYRGRQVGNGWEFVI